MEQSWWESFSPQAAAGILSSVVTVGILSLGLAWWHRRRRNRRVTQVIRADLCRATRIADHNASTAAEPLLLRPRPFIRFPVASYETLLFGNDVEYLTEHPAMLEAMMRYLDQAYHVNAMIDGLERGERDYLPAIAEYCARSGAVQQSITALLRTLS